MYSSFVSKRLVSISILVVVAIHLISTHSVMSINQTNAYLHHKCIKSQGTYKSGSPYERNVQKAIDHISTKIEYGFVHIVSGSPNTIFPMIQCRGDISESMCRSCLFTAFSGVRRRCPNSKGSIIWYDHCVLKIYSVYNYREIDYENYVYLYNTKEVRGDTNFFNKKTRDLLYKLKEKASSKENNRLSKNYMYATGQESFMSMKLYAMAQCTGDMSFKNCSVCLDWITSELPKCCNGKQGGSVLSTSCNFRYELYPFVNPIK